MYNARGGSETSKMKAVIKKQFPDEEDPKEETIEDVLSYHSKQSGDVTVFHNEDGRKRRLKIPSRKYDSIEFVKED